MYKKNFQDHLKLIIKILANTTENCWWNLAKMCIYLTSLTFALHNLTGFFIFINKNFKNYNLLTVQRTVAPRAREATGCTRPRCSTSRRGTRITWGKPPKVGRSRRWTTAELTQRLVCWRSWRGREGRDWGRRWSRNQLSTICIDTSATCLLFNSVF